MIIISLEENEIQRYSPLPELYLRQIRVSGTSFAQFCKKGGESRNVVMVPPHQVVSLLGILWILQLLLNSQPMLAKLHRFYLENKSEDKYEEARIGGVEIIDKI